MRKIYYKPLLLTLAWLGMVVSANAQCTPPTTPIINTSPAGAVCGQQTVTFEVDPSTVDPMATYSWTFGDPSSTSNTATGTTVTHSFTPNPSGASYNVTVTATPTGAAPQAVTWTDMVNVSVNGADLTKTDNSWSYSAGAASTQTVGEGESVGFVANANVKVAVGLSTVNSGADLNSIDYALVADGATDQIQIHENSGTSLGNFGSFVTGDTLGVGVLGGNVVYYKNGVVVYTSSVAPTLPLIVDVSIPYVGASIDGAFVVGQYCTSTASTTVVTTATPSFVIGSAGFDRLQTCKTIINPGDALNVTFGFSSGYNPGNVYQIDYGDGAGFVPLAGNVTSYSYTSPGVYIVTVSGTSGGCTSTYSDTVFYLDRPLADMNIAGTADVCAGETVFALNNTDTINHRVVYYVWEWDDGTRDTVYYQDSAQHVFNLGTNLACNDIPSGGMPYDVTLYAVNECFLHTNTSPITVSQTPEGDLSNIDVECTSVASTSGIEFSLDYCTYGIAGTPTWNFDDPASGASDTLAFPPDNPTHIFVGGPGFYDVTVNVSTLCGEFNDTSRVHILQEPTASATFSTNSAGGALANGDGCNPIEVYYNNTSVGDSLVFNWTVTPSAGVTYINGTSDTSASPQFLFNTAGDFIITMSALNQCDTSSFVDTIRVLDGPTITLNPPTPTCDSFIYTPSITYFSGGGVINNYAWEFRELDGTVLGTSNQPYPTYNFTSSGTYVVQVTIINDCTTKSELDTFTIQATPGPITVNGGVPITTCVGNSSFVITTDSVGGTWSGPAISPSGEFFPGAVNAGTYTVNYHYDIGNGCPADVPVTIEVNPLPTVSAGGNVNVCVNDPAFDLTTGTPVGGMWSGTGITNPTNGTFDPGLVGNGTYTVTYTYTDGNDCENSDDLVVTVFGLPTVDAQGDVTYCEVDYDIQLNAASPAGGTWSGTGVVNAFGGLFNIDTAGGLGTYELYYTYVDNNGCSDIDTIEVTADPVPTIDAGQPDTICINAGTYTLNNFSPTGGAWTGSGIIGTGPGFSPVVAGLGIHELVYNNGTGTCAATDTVEFVVSDFTPVDAGNDTLVCAETDAFTLTAASPSGGVWSGTGITDVNAGIFDPNVAGTGTFTLSYTYMDPVTDCSSTDEIEVTVAPLPVVDAGGTAIMCDTAASFPISGFTPASGGIWSGPGITNPGLALFNPNLAGGIGQYMLYYTYADGNGCASTDSLLMDIVYGDTLRVKKSRDTICINNGIYTITDFEPLGGSWSGNGIIGSSPNFSPTAAGVGTHTLTYLVGTGSCQKQITMQIIVQDIPVVDAGSNTLVCANEPVFTLSGHSPLGGTWTGTGIIDGNVGTFDPSITPGTYSLTYTYIDPVTGCENVDTRSITISPLPNVSVTGPVTECYIPTDITLTNYNPAGGIWSGPGIVDANNGIFNGDTAGGIGTYELVYTYTDGNQCVSSDTLDITLVGAIVADAGPGDTICVYDNEITLTGFSPAGGTWTGTGLTNSTTGTFDPSQVSAGTYTLTYTVGTGTCESSAQTTVLVGGIPNVNAQSNEFVCVSEPAFTLQTATPANGTWSGTGIIDSVLGIFDPAVSGTGLHTLTYSYTNPITGCVGSDTKNVRVRPLPTVNAGDTTAYCNTPTDINLSGYTPTSGGIWSGPGIVDANNGVFNPITAGDVGEYDVVLTYTNNNNCTNWDTLHIIVTAGDTVNAGPNDTLCISADPITLGGYPSGGVWSGSGITNTSGIFDPGQVAAGFHYPVYTVGTGTCERKDTIEIFVSGLPFVDAGINIELCIDAGITTLTGQSPTTGYWTGTGIVDSIAGTFDPTIAGAGLHTMSYIVTNTFGCENVDTRTVRVYSLPIVNAGDTITYCYTPNNIQLTGFTPTSGGIWTGTGIIDANNGVFNANMAGATGIGFYDDIVLTYTDGNNCTNLDTLVIQTVFGDTINAGPDLAMCIDNGLYTLTGFIPTSGGSWSGTGIVNTSGVFDPSTAGSGLHQLIYTFGTGTCLKRDTIQVNVGAIPAVVAGSNQEVCIDEPAFNFTGFSPSGGIWTGNGITDATLGTFNADSAGAGLHTLTYTYINTITGCENSATKTVRVNALPLVNAGDTAIYCNNQNNITLSGYTPLGGNWTGTGIIDGTNGIFNTISAGGEGTYYPIYTYTDVKGCTNFDTLVVEVIYGDTVDAGPPIGICITDGDYTISNGYTPSSGGTWSGPGIIDATLGIFDPTIGINQSYTVYYTYGIGTCQKIDSTTIFVGAVPIVEAGLNDTICELDAPLQLTNYTPSNNGIWSGTGITDALNGIFDPSVAGAGTHTLTYYYENTFTGCSDSDTKLVTVKPPPTVNAGNNRTICETGDDITLPGFSPAGGIWSGPGIVDPYNGIFNDFVAGGIGLYYVYYTYTDPNGCSNFDSVRVKVQYGDTVTAGPDRNVCIDGGLVTLIGSPVGGTWSGDGITDPAGTFDPTAANAGVGNHTLTYTYGPSGFLGTCIKTDEMNIFVSPILTITAGPDLTVCEADAIFTLSGNSPSNGTWSGTGIVDTALGTFDPSVAGIGTHTITYAFTVATTGCSDTDTRTVTVTPPPTVSAGTDQTFCNSNTSITLSGNSPIGGTWSGAGVIDQLNGIFNTQIAGGIGYNNADTVYQVIYEYATGSCADRDTIDITVEFGDTVYAGLPDTVCVTDATYTLTGYSPLGGSWSGTGIIDPFAGTFDPPTAGAGLHTLSYTYGVGTCEKTETKTVRVYALPVVSAGADFAVCVNDAVFALSGYSPLGGTWAGTGITDVNNGTFDPSIAGVGTYTLTYNYIHPITGCENTDTRVIVVNDLPVITMADTIQYCDNTTNITLSGYTPLGGTWSGPGIIDPVNGIFNSNQSGANGIGVYQLLYTYTDGNGCSNTEDLIIDVIYGDTIVSGPNESVCIDDAAFNLSGFSPMGGTWTGTGIVDGLLGTFDPLTAGVGTYTLTYTYGDATFNCEKIVTKTVTVHDLPVVDAGNDQTICLNDASFTLNGYSPIGGTWSGTGITDSLVGTFDASVAGVGSHTLTYYYINPATGCDAFDTKTIIVNDLPIITMVDTVQYCDNPNNITLTGYSPSGGVWSGPGIVDVTNGIFNSTQAGANGVGVYQIIYTYTNSNGCSNTEDLIINVIYGDTVVAGPNESVCIDGAAFNLSGFSPMGGTWTGTGIVDATNGTFDPLTAGVGTYTLTYTYGDATFNCEKIVTKTVTVHDLPVVDAGNDQTVCLNDASFTLNGYSPIGGTWSGTGITDSLVGIFDASVAGVGTHTLTYYYINPATGCDAFDTKTIIVNDLPVITMVDTTQYCDNPNNITLTGYSPAGGIWTGPGIVDATAGIFNSTQAGANGVGVYQVFYTYTNANGCSNTEDLILDIIYGDTVVAGPNVAICYDNGLYTLTGFSPIGGTWTGTGIVDAANGVFDPVVAGVGTHTISYSIGTGTCEKTVFSTITVEPLPVVNAGLNESVCINDAEYMLSGQSPAGGTWSGTGITDGTLGLFNPSIAGIGTHTITYAYTNPATGCQASDTKLITINSLPIVTVQDTVFYCLTNNNITLTGYSPTGGVWTGTGIVDNNGGIFNGNSAGGVGTYQAIYTYTNVNGCDASDTMIIVVDPAIPMNAGPDVSMCIDNGNYQLTGFSPLGGTWTGTGIIDAANGIFDPQLLGANGGTVTLTYTVGSGTCTNSDNITVFVGTPPTVNAGSDQTVCLTDNAFSLIGASPPNGVWTGTGVTNPTGTFDPLVAGSGTFTLTYTYTNSVTGCQNFDTKTVTVLPPPSVEAGDTVVYCNTNQNVTLTNYTPAGGIWTGPGVIDNANGIFNPNVAGGEGTYQLIYEFVNSIGCSNIDSLVVQIIYGDTVRAGVPDTVCIDDPQFTLVGFTPTSGGTWSGNGIIDANAGVFDPATAGVGNHTISYTYGTGTCEKTSTKTVFVGALPTISLGVNDTICVDNGAFNIVGYSPQGGTWSGFGITDANLGIFDPAVSGIGTYTVSYTFVNAITGCDRTVSKQIVVQPLPNVFVTSSVTYCDNSNDITLTGFSPAGGAWTGSGIVSSNGVFNTSIAGGLGYNGADTTYILTYTYTDNFGCENFANMTVNVVFGDTVEAGPNVNVCIDDAPIILTGQTPTSGGTWSGNGITDPVLGTFDPATAGVGTHTITWTFGTGTCLKTSVRSVTVSNPPTISAGIDEVFCINDAPILLSGYSPLGGTWSGTGITDSIVGIFDPTVSGIGTFTLTYYYFNTATNCDASDTKQVTVAPLPTVTVANSVTYCDNPNNITLTGYSPQGGVWTGPGILDGTTGIFNTGQAGGLGYNGADTMYTLTYTYTDGNGCMNSADMTANIIFGDTVEAGPNFAVCTNDGVVTLTGQTPATGGIWSGTGIIDPVVGIFDPVTAGVGTHNITITYGTGTCLKTSFRTVTVSDPPNVNAGANQTICIDASPILLGGYSPTGGTWSGTGITDSIVGMFDPSVSGIGTFTLTYYYYNASTNCDASDTKTITVAPLPTVTTANSVTYCENPNNITLAGYTPQGGIWTGAGILNGANGIFNTGQAGGLGYNGGDTTHILTYTYTDGNGCINSADMAANIIFGDTVEAGPNIAVCTNNGVITLTGQTPATGGTWSGTGIIDPVLGIFDPVTAGVGTHNVTITYGTGTCLKTSFRTITVSDPPNVNAGANQTICIDASPILLSAYSPTGGTWSGLGITDSIVGIFDPSVSGIGTFTLTYYYFNASTNCDASDTKTITVAPLPTVTTANSVTYCDNPNNITLTGHTPQGGIWTGIGILNGANGIFNTGQAGGLGYNNGDTTHILTYTYTDGNGCMNSADMTVNIIFGDTVEAGPNIAVCTNDGVVTLTGQIPASGGTWSGTGIIDPALGIFDPVTAGVGTHNVTITYGTGTCLKTSIRTITVSDPPNVSAGVNQTICIDASPILLNSYSPTGGTWSGLGITDSIVGIFDPSVSGVGTFTLTYYYNNTSTNCDDFDTKTITVAPLPTVTATSSITYCDNPNNITLTGYSPAGGVWTGAGILNGSTGVFNTGQAGGLGYNGGDTTHVLTYTYTDGNGCINSADMTVNIIFGDTVEAGPNFAVCIDAGLVTLTGHTPLGGTWTGNGISDPSGIFDPVLAGVGTHNITITYGTGTCLKTSTRTVTVGAVPTVNAGVDLNICEDDVAFVLGGNTPLGGVWSGIGITDTAAGIFDPAVSGIGTFTITYSFANSVTGCEGVDTREITINPLPIVTTEDSTLYCLTSNNIQLTGFTPTSGGQWSGAGIVNPNTGVFNPGQTPGLGYNNGDTTYTLTYTYTDGNSCTNSEILVVELTEGDTVEAGPDIAVCITDAPFTLTGNIPTTGGTWFGQGITDPIAGTFDPADAGAGTFTLTWQFGTGTCLKTSTRTVTVGSPPTVNAGSDEFICIDAGQVLLSGYSPVGGVWNGTGIVDTVAGIFDPSVSLDGQFTISYYVVNTITGCENTDYKTITVGDLPLVSVTDSVTFCNSPNNILLSDYTTVTPTGGIWIGSGVVDPVNGIFSTAIAGGLATDGGDTTYTVIYKYTGGNTCEAEDTLQITLTYGDTVLAGTPDTLCLGDNPITFTGFSPAGGIWTGTGIINSGTGEFDPNFAGVGLHTVYYTYGTGTCQKQVYKTVLVDAPPTISIGPDQTVCIDATPFVLAGYSPQGGTWSGVGITDGTLGLFDPAAATIGTHTLTYEFINSVSGCSNTDTRDITVVPLPNVTVGDSIIFCDNPNNILLSDYINYNPPGGTWSGAGVVNPTLGIFSTVSAGGLGNYDIRYGYTDGNGCFDDDSLHITVIYGDTVVAGPNVALCIDDGLYQLTGFSPFGGVWSSANTTTNNAIVDPINGTFDPQVAGPGPHTLIYTYGSGTCEKSVSKVVFVGTPPVVNPGANQTICIDVPAFALGGFSPAGGTWSGPGILNGTTGVFNPDSAGVGTHTLCYQVVNQVTGCETTICKTITINPLPSVYAGDTLVVCNNPNDIILGGYSPAGGFWTGTGIIDATGGVFNTNAAGGINVYEAVYHFTDANSCSNNDTLIIDVIYGDTVLAGLNDSVCIDEASFFLGGSPLGGIWTGAGVNSASGMFTAASAGPGSHIVSYTYGSGTCEKTDQKIIYVGTPIAIDAGPDQYACEDALQLFLSGQSIADGIWSGAGVVNGETGEFDPQVVGVGFHTVVYTYIDPVTGCVSIDTKIVEVKELPVVAAGGTVTYCDWPLDIPLTNYSPTGTGGVWSGLGVVNPTLGTFNTGIAGGIGTHTITYTFTDNFGCINSDDLVIDVIYGDTVKAGPDVTVCIDGGDVQLLGNSPVGGYYSGLGVDSFGVFDPTITGGGVHEIVYTQGFETCVKSDTLEVTVIDLTGTTAGPDESTCLESGPVMLSGNLPLGGVWTGSGIVDANLGLFDPQVANSDTVFITYTFTDAASGCFYSDTKMVTVTPLPNINFIMSADTVCISDTVSFVNTSDVNVTNFKWFFGDGDTSIFFQPTHVYNTAGTYNVMLVGVSPEGCPDTSIQVIEIYELPTPSFTMTTDNGCGPLAVGFTNTSIGQDMEFLWDFGNGQTSTLQNPLAVTYQQGIFDTLYVITLEVTNRCGVVTFTDTVHVDPIPNAIITADLLSGCTPLPVNFDNFSTGNATSYLWDFGNGNISTDSIPGTQFFTTVDTNTVYTVTLTASNACGSDVTSIDITVEPGSINALFNADTTVGCQPLTVTLTSFATLGSTVTWDFGDGTTLAGPTANNTIITHEFDTSGVFTITQYVSNYCGLDTFSLDITVHPRPVVDFTHAPFVCQDVPLQITNISPQLLAGVFWDFGDGTTSTAANPQHAYTTPGTYTITMTGYSLSYSCPADTQRIIQVLGKPTATFAPSANSGCAPLGVSFTNTSSNGALYYAWEFGDGNVSNLENPTHQFTGTGNYTVTLTVADVNGCEDDTTMVNFIVFPSPISAFVPDANQQCGLNDYVELTNTSQGANQYYWNFGNGQYSTLTNPIVNYNQLGDYTITLITQNQYNCTDTTQTLYSVLPAPAADFEIATQNGCEPLTVQFTQASTNSTLFYWYFGDGDSAAVANPIHTYNDGGTYDVMMVASLDDQCFDTFYIPGAVYVDQAPTAAFTIQEITGNGATGTYNFVNNSIGATNYYWDFGDGATSTVENPQHRYDYNGLRQVRLIAVSATGCEDTLIVELEPTFFKGLYVPNAFSPKVGIGDVREFRPVGVALEEYKVEVFSQWGELLWSSDVLDANGVPVEGWDGTYQGQPMPQGAYVWKVHAIFADGSNWEGMPDFNGVVRKIGSVTLLD